MNRRTFVASIAAGLLIPRTFQTAPTAPPSRRPAEIPLGDGITLVDYRAYPGDRHSVIGEIRNDRDHMVDAPVVSLRWPSASRSENLAWASPVIPVIEPGGSVPVFGPLPHDGEPGALLDAAQFELCTPVEAGQYTERQQSLQLDLRMTYERYRRIAYRGSGRISNLRSVSASQIAIRGVVRDGDKRIAGVTPVTYIPSLRPDTPREFTIWMAETLEYKANPVPLISGLDYSVEISAGTHGPLIMPACTGVSAARS